MKLSNRNRKTQANVIRFVSPLDRDCRVNQEKLIERAKLCGAYKNVEWDSECWQINDTEVPKTRSHKNCRKNFNIWFTQHKKTGKKTGDPFEGRFGQIVRSVIRLRHFSRGQTVTSQMVFIRGCRYVYDSLMQKEYDITYLTQDDLNRAAYAASCREKKLSAYKVIGHIEEFAALIDKNQLARVRLNWKHSKLKRPSEMSPDRLDDPTALKARHEKLPTDEAYEAVGYLYQIIPVEDWKNRVLILLTSLLCLLGRRIGEILTLPAQRIQTDYSGKKFLYFYPQKKRTGNIEVFKRKLEPLTKTIALVEDILNELYDLTDEQREISAWIYENEEPYLDGLKLTGFDESSSINLKNYSGLKAPDSFLKTRGIETYRKAGQVGCFFRYSDLVKKLRKELFLRPALHVTNPRQNLYLKDILPVGFRNFAHSKKPTFKYATEPINEQHLRDFLNGRRGIVKSIFAKHGLNEKNGEIICLTSHQPRHFLNNVLDEGGAPDTIQLEWFGRTYEGDNKAYQHKTTVRRALQFKKDVLDGNIEGSVARVLRVLPKSEKDAFLDARIRAVHDVGIGYCVHDFLQNPCEKSCSEGCLDFHWEQDSEKCLKLLKRRYALTWQVMEVSKEKLSDGHYNAQKWLKHTEALLTMIEHKIEELCGNFNRLECLAEFERD